MPKRERKLIARNRSARHEYFVDETFEAGIELRGTEVRSLRERACQITECLLLNSRGTMLASWRAPASILAWQYLER